VLAHKHPVLMRTTLHPCSGYATQATLLVCMIVWHLCCACTPSCILAPAAVMRRTPGVRLAHACLVSMALLYLHDVKHVLHGAPVLRRGTTTVCWKRRKRSLVQDNNDRDDNAQLALYVPGQLGLTIRPWANL
jgi:hypothetical protein